MPTGEPLAEVTAVLEVLTPPRVARLYFWALQASFATATAKEGAAHLGLQWGAGGGVGRSVNWGGYDGSGAVLPGSDSALPSRTDDPNTRDYAWAERRPYRLRVHRRTGDPVGWPGTWPGTWPVRWRGEVTDLATGTSTVVRDLLVPATHLSGPAMWSEVFADCDAPPVSVRWSGMAALTASGRRIDVRAVVAGYQSRRDGGCDNTTAELDGGGVLQVTNTRRSVPSGARLAVS